RRKPFVVSASACMIVALVAMPLMPNFWTLVAAFILYHVGDGLSSPRDPLKQEIVPPHERGRATGAMTWCQNFATVVFYAVMLGRFDEVTFFAGVPLHGESVIYWSAALLLATMLLLVALGIKETDQKSPLRGQRLSIRNFVGGLLDRELWPVYLIVFSFGLLNFFSGFGPFLSTLLYTDQWLYTKQEMGTNVAIGGAVNIFIIGLLTVFADRLPRMLAFRTFICLSLAWNVFYFCYVNFVLPDRRPSLVEIILFGEVLSILSILIGLVYVPLTYDYVRRNKMGTFAAGAQIATRGTQLFTLNGVGLFVWAHAVLFQPPAGETTRVVLREDVEQAGLLASLRSAEWTYPHERSPVPATDVSATGWQADNVVTDFGRAWEIRLRNRASEALAEERRVFESQRSVLVAERKKQLDAAASAEQRGDFQQAAAARVAAAKSDADAEALALRLGSIDAELSQRANEVRSQVLAVLGSQLMEDGAQVVDVQLRDAVIIEVPTAARPDGEFVERLLADLRRDEPAIIDLRPVKLAQGYGMAVSAVAGEGPSTETVARSLHRALLRIGGERAPDLFTSGQAPLDLRTERALTLELQVVERPVSAYVSPVTRAVNRLLAFFDRAPSPTRKLDAIARQLRVAEETNHVRVTVGRSERTIAVTAVLQPTATRASERADAVAERIATGLGGEADGRWWQQACAFYERVERAAAAQRVTVAQPILAATYAPMRYDYMSGYIWVFFVGVIGIALTFVFGRLEARGRIRKRGIEEAEAS
ncbi:MAG TPA: MFS transporter, partial [Candidatus Synoicihabitans sp.]|nr:MFS transporter [Candidatus Synoicihabitans sp.]